MPLTSDIGSRSFNLGLEVFRARIAANGRGDITVGGETVSIVYVDWPPESPDNQYHLFK
ncbi:T3SS effector NleG [Escherichia coli]|nr:T3SS effector NleG [Escherichia coli]CTT97366.1 T3SS effector NleG [Escherichia coli]